MQPFYQRAPWRLATLRRISMLCIIFTAAALPAGTGLSGTKTIGGAGADYATLTAAFAGITTNTLAANVTLILQSGYTSTGETFPLTPPALAATKSFSVTIYPAVSGLSIASGSAAGTINCNGAQHIIFDGRVGGTGSVADLAVTNSATTGYVMQFSNESSNNTARYCVIKGMNTATSGGCIVFKGTTGLYGNDNNLIDHCVIKPDAGTPCNAVYAAGSTTTTDANNSNNIISNCSISDFFSAGNDMNGILLSTGNTAWTISGNSFFESVTRNFTGTGNIWSAIQIANTDGGGFQITNNNIGGQSAGCGGGQMTFTGSGVFIGMKLTLGGAEQSVITGNMVANCRISTSSTSVNNAAVHIISGYVNCSNNTIGSMTSTGNIAFSSSSTAAAFNGIIIKKGAANCCSYIQNNQIGGVSAGTSAVTTLAGIQIQGTAGNYTVSGNSIGSSTIANSISNATTGPLYGLLVTAGSTSPPEYISNNTICNLTQSSTGTTNQLIGISVPGTSGGVFSISGNSVSGLTSFSTSAATGLNAALIGMLFSANTDAGQTISANRISGLSVVSASSSNVIGLYYYGPYSGTNIINGNFIHSLSASSQSASLTGLFVVDGVTLFSNNMIRLGIDTTGNAITTPLAIYGISEQAGTNSFYHNSIYIGGIGVGAAAFNTFAFYSIASSAPHDYRNNIFMNSRSTAAAGGKQYAVRYAGGTASVIAGYNILVANGNGGITGYNGADQPSLERWQSATGFDVTSTAYDPHFSNPAGSAASVDLHISPSIPSSAEGTGCNIAAVSQDFDGQMRNQLTPVDIGADAGNFLPPDYTAPIVQLTPPPSIIPGTSTQITAHISDASGVPGSGAFIPQLYFRKNNGTWFVTGGSLTGGTTTDGQWVFVLVFSTVGGVSGGDSISYFVTAQDIAQPPNIAALPASGFSATNVNTILSPPANPGLFHILPAISGIFTVGNGGTYPTLTAAMADYNSKIMSGPVTLLLTDPLYGINETYPLVIKHNSGSSASNTVTLRPIAGIHVSISGSSATALLQINDARYLLIDGTDTRGEQGLTLTNTNTTAGTSIICFSSQLSGGCAFDTIRGCSFIGQGNGATLNGIVSKAPGTSGQSHTNIGIVNCRFSSLASGLVWLGSTTIPDTGLCVRNCFFGSNTEGGRLKASAIKLNGLLSFIIEQDSIVGITSSATRSVAGIEIDSGCSLGLLSRNLICNVTNSNAGGFSAQGIMLGSTGSNCAIQISNNYIRDINSLGSGPNSGYGLSVLSGGGYAMYYNTIVLSGTTLSPAATPACLFVSASANQPNALSIKDNIFVNNQSGCAAAYTLLCNSPATVFSALDYNDYYIPQSGCGVLWRLGSDVNSLDSWRALTGKEAHSISADPLLHTFTNLHIIPSTTSPVSGTGTSIPGIGVDYDGDTRDPVSPDIGADEFIARDMQLSSVTVTPAVYTPVLDTATAGGIALKPSESGSVTASFLSNGRKGLVPEGIINVSPYYWLVSTSRTGFTDTVRFYYDHIAGNGVTDFSALHLLRREGDGAAWSEVALSNKTPSYVEAVLSDFSEFALGSGSENAFPVTLTSFTATCRGNDVQVNWQTQTEINTASFVVERCRPLDGLVWRAAGTIRSAGNTNNPRRYSFTDHNLPAGQYQYRLRTIDNDGSSSSGPVAHVTVALPRTLVMLQNYPNPCNPSTVFSYALPADEEISLKVFTLTGQEMATVFSGKQSAGWHSVSFNTQCFASGIYFYVLKTPDRSVTKKLLILK
jgi:hypothetical protein